MTNHAATQKQASLKSRFFAFSGADTKHSVNQLFNTFVPFFALWFLAYFSLNVSYLLTLAFTVIAAGFLTRIFIIFHDCRHQSFSNKETEPAVRVYFRCADTVSVPSMAGHSIHHATSDNLDKRGTGDIWMMTVKEYNEASAWTKVRYRLYRNPFIMFILGPIYVFLIQNRFNVKGARRKERWNTYFTNAAIVLLVAATCLLVGWENFCLFKVRFSLFRGQSASGSFMFSTRLRILILKPMSIGIMCRPR